VYPASPGDCFAHTGQIYRPPQMARMGHGERELQAID
jgi:hypothetical protein